AVHLRAGAARVRRPHGQLLGLVRACAAAPRHRDRRFDLARAGGADGCERNRGATTLMVEMAFAAGTLEVRGLPADAEPLPECRWDKRSSSFRAPALAYAAVVLALRKAGIAYEDRARAYTELATPLALRREPRPFQSEALAAFRAGGGRGV